MVENLKLEERKEEKRGQEWSAKGEGFGGSIFFFLDSCGDSS
jgi:hypothetical protein